MVTLAQRFSLVYLLSVILPLLGLSIYVLVRQNVEPAENSGKAIVETANRMDKQISSLEGRLAVLESTLGTYWQREEVLARELSSFRELLIRVAPKVTEEEVKKQMGVVIDEIDVFLGKKKGS